MQHIYTARDAMDAHFLVGLLQEEGIEAVVQGEALEGTWGGLPLTSESLPSVWVNDADVSRAAPVLRTYQMRPPGGPPLSESGADAATADAPRPTWACAHCGERVEMQFTNCWHCGHPAPPAAGAAETLA